MNLKDLAQNLDSEGTDSVIDMIAAALLYDNETPNEICIGKTPREAQLVADTLAKHRGQVPEKFKNHVSLISCLNKYLDGENAFNIDWSWFALVTMAARAKIRQTFPQFELIDFSRYLITQSRAEQTTGFSGKPGGGYYYMNDLGFSCVCSGDIDDRFTRSFELARNYLHDSLHRCTFKSFRLKSGSANGEPEVYRYDYGINRRLENGDSYSSVAMTQRVPETINLNLLMDGANYIYISRILRSLVSLESDHFPFLTEKLGSPALREVFKEVLGNDFDRTIFPASDEFYGTVIKPTQMFLDHWQSKWDRSGSLMDMLIGSLFTGYRGELEAFFVRQTGNRNAWEDMFRRPGFVETDGLSRRLHVTPPAWHAQTSQMQRMSELGNIILLKKAFEVEERGKDDQPRYSESLGDVAKSRIRKAVTLVS